MPAAFRNWKATIVLCAASLLVVVALFTALRGRTPGGQERVVRYVCELLTRFHLLRQPINDDISANLFDRYLQLLDSEKLYFLEADIDEFRRQQHLLDDQLRSGDLTFARDAYATYLVRVESALRVAHHWIDAEHDFSKAETMVVDAAEVGWAESEEDRSERWRLQIKYLLLSQQLDGSTLEEAREALHGQYRRLAKSYADTRPEDVLEGYLIELAQCFDPHSAYLSMQSNEEFQIEMSLSLAGIGAQMQEVDGFATVMGIIPGGPAEKEGQLQAGDRIVAVAEQSDEFVPTTGMSLDRVVQLVRGEPGTAVRLRIQRPATGQTLVIEIVRQVYELEAAMVKGEVIETEDRLGGRAGRVGVIVLPSFYHDFEKQLQGEDDFRSVAADFEELLEQFEQARVDAVVIDLRGNGGGSLTEAIDCSGLLLDTGPIVQIRDAEGDIQIFDDFQEGAAFTGPVVVVCDRLSASASEIFAGAIQDYRRGVIVGDTTTYGKGTVQTVMPVGPQMFLSDRQRETAAVKLTVSQFYRANGASTQERGVESDLVLPSVIDVMEIGESFTPGAVPFHRVPPARYRTVDMIDSVLISELRKRSEQRLDQHPDFTKIREQMQEYRQQLKQNVITVSEAGLKADREHRNHAMQIGNGVDPLALQKPVLPDTAYNNELLQIALDYAGLLEQAAAEN